MTLQKFSDRNFNSMYKNKLKTALFFPLAGMLFLFAIVVISPVSEIIKLANPIQYPYDPFLYDAALSLDNIRYILFGTLGPVQDFFPDTSVLMYIIVILASIFCASMTFRDLSGKKTANVYYSLGFSRTKLFVSTYLSGATAIVLMTVIPFAVSFIVNAFSFGISKELLTATVFSISVLCNVSLIAYTLASIGIILSGMFFEGAFFAFFLNSISAIFTFCICMFSEGLLTGGGFADSSGYYYDAFLDSFSAAFLGRINVLNSLAHSVNNVAKFSSCLYTTTYSGDLPYLSLENWETPKFIPLIVWTVILGGLICLGIYLFNKKKVEDIGFFASSKLLYRIFFGTMIAAFSALGTTRCRVFTKGLTWLYILILLAGSIITCFIVILILSKLSKIKIKQEVKFFPLYAGFVIIFATVFSTGFFGFANKIPEPEKVLSVRINSFTGDLYGYYENGIYDEYGTNSITIDTFSNESYYEISTKSGITDICELHRDLIKTDNAKVSADYSKTKIGAVISLEYTLANGQELKRTYHRVTPQIIDKMLGCDDIEEFIKTDMTDTISNAVDIINSQPITEDSEVSKYITVFSNDLTSANNVDLTSEQLNGLVEAYKKDMEKLPLKELYKPSGKSLGILAIRENYRMDESYNEHTGEVTSFTYSSDVDYATIPESINTVWDNDVFLHITDKMVNTVKWAKEAGIYKYFEIDKKMNITSVEATHNNSSYIKLALADNNNYNLLFNAKSHSKEYMNSFLGYDEAVHLPGSHIVYNLTESEIEYIRKNAYPVYLTTDTGYFLRLSTDTEKIYSIDLFIPDSKLTPELKVKFAEGIAE